MLSKPLWGFILIDFGRFGKDLWLTFGRFVGCCWCCCCCLFACCCASLLLLLLLLILPLLRFSVPACRYRCRKALLSQQAFGAFCWPSGSLGEGVWGRGGTHRRQKRARLKKIGSKSFFLLLLKASLKRVLKTTSKNNEKASQMDPNMVPKTVKNRCRKRP